LCCCDKNAAFFEISWNGKGCENCAGGTKMPHSLKSVGTEKAAKIVLVGQKMTHSLIQLESKYCKILVGQQCPIFSTDLGIVLDLLGMKESPILFPDVSNYCLPFLDFQTCENLARGSHIVRSNLSVL
jgi:hypothetical protein